MLQRSFLVTRILLFFLTMSCQSWATSLAAVHCNSSFLLPRTWTPWQGSFTYFLISWLSILMIEALGRWGYLFCSEWVFCAFCLWGFFLFVCFFNVFSLVFPSIPFIPAVGLEWHAWWADLRAALWVLLAHHLLLLPHRATALRLAVGQGQEEADVADLALTSIQEDPEEQAAQGRVHLLSASSTETPPGWIPRQGWH